MNHSDPARRASPFSLPTTSSCQAASQPQVSSTPLPVAAHGLLAPCAAGSHQELVSLSSGLPFCGHHRRAEEPSANRQAEVAETWLAPGGEWINQSRSPSLF